MPGNHGTSTPWTLNYISNNRSCTMRLGLQCDKVTSTPTISAVGQSYMNARYHESENGQPAHFIAFACNTDRPEVREALLHWHRSKERPDPADPVFDRRERGRLRVITDSDPRISGLSPRPLSEHRPRGGAAWHLERLRQIRSAGNSEPCSASQAPRGNYHIQCAWTMWTGVPGSTMHL